MCALIVPAHALVRPTNDCQTVLRTSTAAGKRKSDTRILSSWYVNFVPHPCSPVSLCSAEYSRNSTLNAVLGETNLQETSCGRELPTQGRESVAQVCKRVNAQEHGGGATHDRCRHPGTRKHIASQTRRNKTKRTSADGKRVEQDPTRRGRKKEKNNNMTNNVPRPTFWQSKGVVDCAFYVLR